MRGGCAEGVARLAPAESQITSGKYFPRLATPGHRRDRFAPKTATSTTISTTSQPAHYGRKLIHSTGLIERRANHGPSLAC